jgi:hypothetical protein
MRPANRFPISLSVLLAGGVSLAGFLAHVERSSGSVLDRVVAKDQSYVPFAGTPINYRSNDLNDPIAELQKRMDRGETSLQYDPQYGFLKSVLNALQVPVNSQTLVFSKTSFQFPQITPARPRALYYNDDVYVGRVHNGKFLEFISFDPMQGAIFYVLDEHPVERPRFERAAVDCVQCHVAPATRGVPGVFLRSVFTSASGYQVPGTHAFVTGHESPLDQRWGGWYVTGARGVAGSMANVTVADRAHPEQLDRASAANLNSLGNRIDASGYLTGSSDVVALLVLAHQTQMHNLITQVNYQTRLALFDPKPNSPPWQDAAEQLVRYLLFTNEAPLAQEVVGSSGFAAEFTARGPRDSQGRSLRDFDLHTRIFKYKCSYLIYSRDFDAVPSPAKEYIYRRLLEVLSGRDTSPDFASLSAEDRRAIFEILVDTKPGVPNEWKHAGHNS